MALSHLYVNIHMFVFLVSNGTGFRCIGKPQGPSSFIETKMIGYFLSKRIGPCLFTQDLFHAVV